MKSIYILSAFVITLMANTPVFAGHQSHTTWARVVDVSPAYKIVRTHAPERQCWVETTAIRRHHNDEVAGTLAGGIIGGTLGHAVGHSRRDKHAASAVGAIIGMAVGNNIASKNNRHHESIEYRDVERCEVRHVTRKERRLIGYDVTYRYKGDLYKTRTHSRPGKRIKVAVNVRPYRH